MTSVSAISPWRFVALAGPVTTVVAAQWESQTPEEAHPPPRGHLGLRWRSGVLVVLLTTLGMLLGHAVAAALSGGEFVEAQTAPEVAREPAMHAGWMEIGPASGVAAMMGPPSNAVIPVVPSGVYLSVAQARALTGVSRATLYRWIRRGLPCHRPGGRGHPRFLAAEIHAFLRADAPAHREPSIVDITG